MKKETKTQKITIDALAIMMNNGFETLRTDVGELKKDVGELKKDMNDVRKDVDDVKEDMNDVKKDVSSNTKVSSLILKEISAIHEDNKRFRETLASLNMDGISYSRRIENLTIRVEKLEIENK